MAAFFYYESYFFTMSPQMKKAQWEFSFKKSNLHFLKQFCLYFYPYPTMIFLKVLKEIFLKPYSSLIYLAFWNVFRISKSQENSE